MQINNISLNQNFGAKFSKGFKSLLYNTAVEKYDKTLTEYPRKSDSDVFQWNSFKNNVIKLKKMSPDVTIDAEIKAIDSDTLSRDIFVIDSNGNKEWLTGRLIDITEEATINKKDELEHIIASLQEWENIRKTPRYQKVHKVALDLIG